MPQMIYEIVLHTPCLLDDAEHAQAFNGVLKRQGEYSARWTCMLIYTAGVLMGIRQERQRRHKKRHSSAGGAECLRLRSGK